MSTETSAVEPARPAVHPVRVRGDLSENLSRWLWLVKWILAIPHYLILIFLGIGFLLLTIVAFFAILVVGRYPRPIFDINVGIMRWSWRVMFYTYNALGTDRYPPFSLRPDDDYPADLTVDYPERLSRGLVLVKWWLLAVPHYLILVAMLSGAVIVDAESDYANFVPPLLDLLVLIAAIALLCTGRYPRGVFDFLLGINRWAYRVVAYAALMRDEYPPFRLDQGAREPER
ncbi:Uncharacterised protein [Nocardia otitidiscaviarum]|uniref:DUF4389 domain-containing protein n=1 Tax=Nocardia otitidiscaviarum TaxID=1823 RepID=A0A378YMQ2_9NOCA|nr:DUF4389 domain-containing protein [Nocardia otitidiscaviarum]SUA77787.1 Uncharacterised protein [Nocardia otitidiscaviarum]